MLIKEKKRRRNKRQIINCENLIKNILLRLKFIKFVLHSATDIHNKIFSRNFLSAVFLLNLLKWPFSALDLICVMAALLLWFKREICFNHTLQWWAISVQLSPLFLYRYISTSVVSYIGNDLLSARDLSIDLRTNQRNWIYFQASRISYSI